MQGERQRLVFETFIELADTLAGDYDVAELLHVLVERCANLLAVGTAGVLLEGPGGRLRLAVAINDEMQRIEALEVRQRAGPCYDAYRSGEPVIVEDLRDCLRRWPNVTPKLLDLGMRSAHAFPLRLRDDCVGALNLYHREPGPFDKDDIRLGHAFADMAAIGILQQRKVAAAEQRNEQLQYALDSRVTIEQAKGVLAERHGASPSDAFAMIRAHARRHNRRLREVCEQILAGDDSLRFDSGAG